MVELAAVYARISSDPDGDHLGVNRQLADCRRLAAARGWTIAEEYVDNDVSAYKRRTRPAYRRMLDDIKGGYRDAVIVWHLDRLHRQPRELEEFFEVCDAAGLRSLASVTGDTDLSTEDGRFMARILGAVASKESADKSRRLLRKHLELAEKGTLPLGGTRPFGYADDKRTVVTGEAALIKEAASRILAGDSLYAIANDWNDRGVRTSKGNPWNTSTLKRMLISARISGQRSHRGDIVAKGDWPAILTPQQTTRLRAVLSDPARRTNRAVRRYLLTGLLRCGLCGSHLVARPTGDGTRKYICMKAPGRSGCGHVFVKADPLEAFISEAVLYRLDNPQLAKMLATPDDSDLNQLQESLDADQAQLDELAQAYGNKEISLRDWMTAKKPIDRRAEQTRHRLSRLTGTTAVQSLGSGPHIRETWKTLTLNRQHAVIAALIDSIDVAPAAVRGRKWFDPNRVTAHWKA